MIEISYRNRNVNGHRFDYLLENGEYLHAHEWNGDKYIVNSSVSVNGRETEYRPIYSTIENSNGGFDIIAFE